jgi:hypothetical protein
MFEPTRDEARAFLVDAWRAHREGGVLSPLQAMAVDVIAAHPEYHALLEAPEAALQREYTPAEGEFNPFLHLHLHLALAEQLSIDQPPGLRAAYERLQARSASAMAAQHAVIDCLAQALWEAQRRRMPPDGEAYVAAVRRRASTD